MNSIDKDKVVDFIKNFIPFVIVVIVILLFKRYIMSPVRVNGDSMYPTLTDGDILILDSISYRFEKVQRNDIVVVNVKDEYIIKRVIGLPGEKVVYKKNQLYVNDQPIEDEFAITTEDFEVLIPDNHYFVLGDNRLNSTDSRFFGTFSSKQIRGRADFVIFPFGRFGSKK